MAEMKVCLLGDVVGSRRASDRAGLHRRLSEVLDEVGRRHGIEAAITVGDEYQAVLPTLGLATLVALETRLLLLPDADLRHGIGRGEVEVLDPATGIQDGSGWWAAREAIDLARRDERSAAGRLVRTRFHTADPPDVETSVACARAVNAALRGRDELVGRLSPISVSVLRDLLLGRTQAEVAQRLDISPSAVSQRMRRDGIAGVLAITEDLRTVP